MDLVDPNTTVPPSWCFWTRDDSFYNACDTNTPRSEIVDGNDANCGRCDIEASMSNREEHWTCSSPQQTGPPQLPPSLDIIRMFRQTTPGVQLHPVLHNSAPSPPIRQWRPSDFLMPSTLRCTNSVAICTHLQPVLVPLLIPSPPPLHHHNSSSSNQPGRSSSFHQHNYSGSSRYRDDNVGWPPPGLQWRMMGPAAPAA